MTNSGFLISDIMRKQVNKLNKPIPNDLSKGNDGMSSGILEAILRNNRQMSNRIDAQRVNEYWNQLAYFYEFQKLKYYYKMNNVNNFQNMSGVGFNLMNQRENLSNVQSNFYPQMANNYNFNHATSNSNYFHENLNPEEQVHLFNKYINVKPQDLRNKIKIDSSEYDKNVQQNLRRKRKSCKTQRYNRKNSFVQNEKDSLPLSGLYIIDPINLKTITSPQSDGNNFMKPHQFINKSKSVELSNPFSSTLNSSHKKTISEGEVGKSPVKKFSPKKRLLDSSSLLNGSLPKKQKCVDEDLQNTDISEEWNAIDVSVEARKKLEKIKNTIGDFICKLCTVKYEDAFKLAKHRCPRIAYMEYKCPECTKQFNSPANLASHRRWHKPIPHKVFKKYLKPNLCNFCQHTFKSTSDLLKHKVEMHGFQESDSVSFNEPKTLKPAQLFKSQDDNSKNFYNIDKDMKFLSNIDLKLNFPSNCTQDISKSQQIDVVN
ncbi:hypothetical protein A3Q56_00857 [Intoshia linei]|uniref:C2H2-type domain-containing protein n=1 Tax=Intoshia linei TaxID=1819745 RepID=A0A177BAY1_9BILA|nr:hypothetical protein A3Q56_00857 [Intoshia linei]